MNNRNFTALISILVVPPVDTLIQLIKNIRDQNDDIGILLHASVGYNGTSLLLNLQEEFGENNWLFLNPKQVETERGYITTALLSNMHYAFNNIEFKYYLILPFNCLQVRPGLDKFLSEQSASIFFDNNPTLIYPNKLVADNQVIQHGPADEFRLNIPSKWVLKRYYNNSNYFKRRHEGLCLKREVLGHIIEAGNHWLFRLYDSGIGKSIKQHLAKLNFEQQLKFRLLPFGFEEVFLATVLRRLIDVESHSYQNFQLCFVDWNLQKPANWEHIKSIINKDERIFFYKWVNTSPEDSTRLEILKNTSGKYGKAPV